MSLPLPRRVIAGALLTAAALFTASTVLLMRVPDLSAVPTPSLPPLPSQPPGWRAISRLGVYVPLPEWERRIAAGSCDDRFLFFVTRGWTDDELPPRARLFLDSLYLHHPEARVYFVATAAAPPAPAALQPYLDAGYSLSGLHLPVHRLCDGTVDWAVTPANRAWLADRCAEAGDIATPSPTPRKPTSSMPPSGFTYTHLTDYLRFYLLHRYGGTYTDTDAVMLRRLPAGEFTGADRSDDTADWFLDPGGHIYVAPGLVRLCRGSALAADALAAAFDPAAYDPTCHNCVGPRVFNEVIIRAIAAASPIAELTLLHPRELYPYPYWRVTAILAVDAETRAADARMAGGGLRGDGRDGEGADTGDARPASSATALAALLRESTSLHLFGHITNSREARPGSLLWMLASAMVLTERPRANTTAAAAVASLLAVGALPRRRNVEGAPRPGQRWVPSGCESGGAAAELLDIVALGETMELVNERLVYLRADAGGVRSIAVRLVGNGATLRCGHFPASLLPPCSRLPVPPGVVQWCRAGGDNASTDDAAVAAVAVLSRGASATAARVNAELRRVRIVLPTTADAPSVSCLAIAAMASGSSVVTAAALAAPALQARIWAGATLVHAVAFLRLPAATEGDAVIAVAAAAAREALRNVAPALTLTFAVRVDGDAAAAAPSIQRLRGNGSVIAETVVVCTAGSTPFACLAEVRTATAARQPLVWVWDASTFTLGPASHVDLAAAALLADDAITVAAAAVPAADGEWSRLDVRAPSADGGALQPVPRVAGAVRGGCYEAAAIPLAFAMRWDAVASLVAVPPARITGTPASAAVEAWAWPAEMDGGAGGAVVCSHVAVEWADADSEGEQRGSNG